MQQFTVPQFIDVEDKIIGPVTVRQFVIILIGGFFIFLQYKIFTMVIFLSMAVPTFLLAIIFAFVKINGAAFHYFLLNIIQTLKRPKVRIWDREAGVHHKAKEPKSQLQASSLVRKPLTNSRISDLSLVLDTGGIYKGENDEAKPFSQLEN